MASLPISQPWHLSLMLRTRCRRRPAPGCHQGRSTITLQVMQGRVGPAGPGMLLVRAGWAGSFPGEKRQLGSFGGSLLPSLGPTGNNAFPLAQLGSRMGLVVQEGQWAGR